MQTFCGLTTDGMLDYLAAIYKLGDSGEKVTTGSLAERMYVSPAAASSMLKRLQDSGFVERSTTDGITLTEQGRLAALQLIRRHRLLEVFLVQTMDYTWDQVDVEAHRLEHAISAAFEERMDRLCGYPTHCPHGDPIPRPDGTLPDEKLICVLEMQPGQQGTLRRVGTNNASILRYLSQLNLTPGCNLTLVEIAPFKGPITLELHPATSGSTNGSSNGLQNGIASNGAANGEVVTRSTQILGCELAEQLFVRPHA